MAKPPSMRRVLPIVWPEVHPYTQASHFDRVDKDPINLLYAGAYADLETAYRVIESDLGLWTDKAVGAQVFAEPYDPVSRHWQDVNRADHPISGWWGRYHTRVFTLYEAHPQLGRLIASPIHRETNARCGWLPNDAVVKDGFDLAREWALDRLRLPSIYIGLPLVKAITQCNGAVVGTDGRAAVVAEPGFFVARGILTKEQEEASIGARSRGVRPRNLPW